MSHFVKTHIERLFKAAGYELLSLQGDRGGIVQGDGLYLTVSPDIAAAARRYSTDENEIASIEADTEGSRRLEIKLYGGSASPDMEGVWLPQKFVSFLQAECSDLYYKAQKDVDAIFDAEDAPGREWDGARDAYAGTVAEFAAETAEGGRIFLRVIRIADQSFNAYESGDDEVDAAEAADIIEGRTSHGSIEIEIHEIEPEYLDADGPEYGEAFDPSAYDPRDYRSDAAARIIESSGLAWPRMESEAYTLELAADIAAEEGELAASRALHSKAVELGLPLEDHVSEAVASPSP